jgi:hypothetical protein
VKATVPHDRNAQRAAGLCRNAQARPRFTEPASALGACAAPRTPLTFPTSPQNEASLSVSPFVQWSSWRFSSHARSATLKDGNLIGGIMIYRGDRPFSDKQIH